MLRMDGFKNGGEPWSCIQDAIGYLQLCVVSHDNDEAFLIVIFVSIAH